MDIITPPLATETPSTPMPTVAPTEEMVIPTPVAEPTPTPPLGELYKSRVNTLNYRSAPNTYDASILGQLGYEDEVYLINNEGDFSLVELMDGQRAYCYSDYLVPAEEALYAYLNAETAQLIDIRTKQPVFEKDGVTPVMVKNELIDLRLHLPGAEYELLFATDRNFIGEPLYPRAIPLLQKDTLIKLQKAFDIFKADGYTLKIYDAYRPVSVQRILYNVIKNSNWVANPDTTASNHNRGCALDISLIDDATGKELEFPTPMHTFTAESARTSKSWSAVAKANTDYMTSVMRGCGFLEIESEWWHFADSDSKKFMTTDVDLGRLNMLPKQN